MKVSKLDHVNFSVSNYKESVDFYSRVFGFEVVEEGDYNGAPHGIMRSGDAVIAIYERAKGERLSNQVAKERGFHRVNHFSFQIEDRAVWEDVIKRENVNVDHEWKYPHSYSWYVIDPTGYEIEVSCWDDGKVVFPPLNA